MKITGGCLKTKEIINEEKVDQIRLYSGDKFESVQEVNETINIVLQRNQEQVK